MIHYSTMNYHHRFSTMTKFLYLYIVIYCNFFIIAMYSLYVNFSDHHHPEIDFIKVDDATV